MANKTIDRKKAVPARSQAAKASPKNDAPKTSRPSGNTPARPSALKPEKSASAGAEVLEAEELETEELVDSADDADEADDDYEPAEDEEEEDEEEEDEEEDEEEVAEEKSAKSRFAKGKKERDLVAVAPQDYSVSRAPGSRLPTFPGSRFLYASVRELRLVTWPSRRETWNWSLVVIGVCIGVAILLGVIDFGLSRFVTWWLSLAH